MITSRTKKQLLLFVLLTLVGVSYVGARYARLDRVIYDTTYDVHAHFAQSGGIFTGAEVTYRGIGIGQVGDMRLTNDGVDVVLAIDKSQKTIPADTTALVGNKSAVGEQYVELDPKSDGSPYLKDGSVISVANTAIPVSTTEILSNLDQLVNSVPQDQLRTVVSELGAGFKGTGPDLSQIIDTSTQFIDSANANFDVTTALIKDSNVVLSTQADKASAIRSFARDLSLFSGTLAGSDKDLRSLIDNGSATANELRTFLEKNQVNIGRLIANLARTGEVTVKHLDGIRQILVLYPYMVAGGYTVTAPGPGGYDAHFGLILTQDPPVCHAGYHPNEFRTPNQTDNKPMDESAACTEGPTSVPRGAKWAPRAGANYRSPVGTYDSSTGKFNWADQTQSAPRTVNSGGSSDVFGKDAWKWMLLRPSMGAQE